MKFSVVIPYYNNLAYIKEAITTLLDIDMINDIVITHDCSNDYSEILKLKHPKIRIYKNIQNWHILHNKRNAIYHAKNSWVICLDSDNSIDENYIKILNEQKLNKNTIYAPEFARPQFDYRIFSGMTLNKHSISHFNKPIFQTFLNTFNYCLNRDEYLKVYEYSNDCFSADSIYFNYLWLKKENSIYIVPGLQYEHRVHKESTFLNEYNKSLNKANYYLQRINELKAL